MPVLIQESPVRLSTILFAAACAITSTTMFTTGDARAQPVQRANNHIHVAWGYAQSACDEVPCDVSAMAVGASWQRHLGRVLLLNLGADYYRGSYDSEFSESPRVRNGLTFFAQLALRIPVSDRIAVGGHGGVLAGIIDTPLASPLGVQAGGDVYIELHPRIDLLLSVNYRHATATLDDHDYDGDAIPYRLWSITAGPVLSL
jgi:hypothetical protein